MIDRELVARIRHLFHAEHWKIGISRSGGNALLHPGYSLTSWKFSWLPSLPSRLNRSEPPQILSSGTSSRSGTAEEPWLFTLHPIPVCLFFRCISAYFVPTVPTLTPEALHKGLLPSCSAQIPRKHSVDPFPPSKYNRLGKATFRLGKETSS